MHPKVHRLCWSCDFKNFEFGSEMENCHSWKFSHFLVLGSFQDLENWIKIPSCNGGKNSRVNRRHPYE
jgi:hypothetical protein